MNTNRIKKAKLVRTNSSRIEEEEKTSFRPPFFNSSRCAWRRSPTKNTSRRRRRLYEYYGFNDSRGSYRDVVDEGAEGGEDVDDGYDGEHKMIVIFATT